MKIFENESVVNLANQNESVINWAKQNFANGYHIHRFNWEILLIILISPMFGFGLLATIDGLFTGKALCLGLILTGLFSFCIVDLWRTRRRMVTYLDSDGVKTRGGKTYLWKNLGFVVFAPVGKQRSSGAIVSDLKSFRAELYFDDGRAMIPKWEELREILEAIPCQIEDRRGKLW